MSDTMDPECAAVEDDLVELALGSLAGRQRAAALGHLDGCPRCSAEVETLSAAADEMLHLLPRAEPRIGFEARVFEHLGPPRRPPRWRTWWARTPRLVLALGALVVLAVVGTGTMAIRHATTHDEYGASGTRSSYAASAPIDVAHFRSGARTVGQVMVYAGNPTWLFMYVDDPAWRGELTCRVILADGPTVTLGHFWPSQGKGAWAASVSQPAGRLTEAQLTDAKGKVLATALLN
jgi:hypothetical protein